MANTSLPNLTERTATANSDLIHVNSGGTDYKETKANFLSDVNASINSLNNSLTNSLTSSFVSVTAKTNFVIDTNNTRRIGNIIVVYVKGHTTGTLTNGELFEVNFTDSVKNGSSTFFMGVGGTWNIDGVGYAFFNASSKTIATNTNWSGKYLHINYVIVLG
jgi:hypothetical protein